MTDAITVNVATGFIVAAMCATSKEQTRSYMRGVFLDARGFIAATNGHMAFAARCNDAFRLADCRPAPAPHALAGIIVPSEALAQAIKAAGRAKGLFVVFERDGNGQWWILYGNARVAFEPVKGSFPDWTRVIPTAPETLTAAHYQPQHITAIGNMAMALRDGKKDAASAFTLHQDGENPALVTFPREVEKSTDKPGLRADCLAVLMPYRDRGRARADAAFTDTFLKG